MRKNIVGFLSNLDAVSRLLKEQREEDEQHNDNEPVPRQTQGHHAVHDEYDSVTTQMRGY